MQGNTTVRNPHRIRDALIAYEMLKLKQLKKREKTNKEKLIWSPTTLELKNS